MFARNIRRSICIAPALLVAASILCGPAAVARAAEKLDVSKLKPGDKLQAQFLDEWETVEFVDMFSDGIANVKRKGHKFPVGRLLRMLRPLPKTARKNAPPLEDPFATEEERAAARKPRTWSDPSGKFKTEATLLRMADDKVLLKRADGKQVSVPMARLSNADQRYVAGIMGTPEPDEPAGTVPDETQQEAEGVALTETDLATAKVVPLAQVDAWAYQPDPAPQATPLRKVRIPLRAPSSVFEQPKNLILLPNEMKAFVVSVDRSPGKKAYRSSVQQCDLQQGSLGAAGVFAAGAAPIDVSPDGKTVLARSVGFGSGVEHELRLYERSGNKVTPAAAWVPYGQEKNAAGRIEKEVAWARFLDPDHVVAINEGGTLSLWSTDGLRPVYRAQGLRATHPALSPGGRYVALPISSGIAILEAAGGKLAGTLPADMRQLHSHALAFSNDGKRLALVQDRRRVRVWDLTTRKLEHDFSIGAAHGAFSQKPLLWVDDNYLLISGTGLVDLKHYARVWTYTRMSVVGDVVGGRLWFVDSSAGREHVLASAAVPSQAIRDKWAKVPADKLLAVKPGMEISIQLPADGSAAEVRKQIAESLTERGMKVVANGNLRLVGTIRPGGTQQIKYQPFRGPTRQPTTYSATETIANLSLQLGNETLWTHTSKSFPPLFLRLKENQTIERGLAEQMKRDSRAFQHVWIPVFVARPNPDAKTDTSPVPAG